MNNEIIQSGESSHVFTSEQARDVADALRSNDSQEIERAIKVVSELGHLALADLIESSRFDMLTKLGNKESLGIEINELLDADKENSSESTSVLVMLDLVGFAAINNQKSHTEGDNLLSLVGKAIESKSRSASGTRKADSLYNLALEANVTDQLEESGFRFGGDELAIVLKNGPNLKRTDLEALVRRKITSILKYRELEEKLDELKIENFGIRAGYTIIDSKYFSSASEVLEAADPKTQTVCEITVAMTSRGGPEIITRI
jgi:GGDEF domain-containing protein